MSKTLPIVTIRKTRVKPVLAGHPWIFSGALAKPPTADPGDTVQVRAEDGALLGVGYYNPHSQIAVRVWGLGAHVIDADFLRTRIADALERRDTAGYGGRRARADGAAYRLINAEADLLPGLIVDRYGEYLVLQIVTAGMEQWRSTIVDALDALLQPAGILERSDADVRKKEGLTAQLGLCRGDVPEQIEIGEGDCRYMVYPYTGQKTGFFLDQRDARATVATVASRLPADARMLNAFAYSGGFGIAAAKAHPTLSVCHIDVSGEAIDMARANAELNDMAPRMTYHTETAFTALRTMRDAGDKFSLIVVDPPKFVKGQSQLRAGLRGYKDINLLALQLLEPGGMLATFSCSGLVNRELFQQVVWEAATDAKQQVQIIDRFGHPADHPTLLSFPEGDYLKGLLLQRL